MALRTTPLFFLEYRQVDNPLIKDLYASVNVHSSTLLAELSATARSQIARHLRALAADLEAEKPVHTGPRALVIGSGPDELLAYK